MRDRLVVAGAIAMSQDGITPAAGSTPDKPVVLIVRAEPMPAVAVIPGVDPADVWAAYEEAMAGRLADHAVVFAGLRNRPLADPTLGS